MKTILLLACAVAISNAVIAQDPLSRADLPPAHKTAMKEGLMKLEGRMWYIKKLPDSMKLDNDIVVYTNGKYATTDGKVFRLPDRGRIDFEGAVEDMDQKIDEINGMIVMKNGYMWVWTLLDKPMPLQNGEYMMPDGTLRLHAGKYVKMKEKTFVDFDGNISEQQW
jgi:hypothetical protein